MEKLIQLTADIGKLWGKYGSSYLSGIGNTLALALIATGIGCVIGFVCGVLNTIPYAPGDHPLKKFFLKVIRAIVRIYVEVFRQRAAGNPLLGVPRQRPLHHLPGLGGQRGWGLFGTHCGRRGIRLHRHHVLHRCQFGSDAGGCPLLPRHPDRGLLLHPVQYHQGLRLPVLRDNHRCVPAGQSDGAGDPGLCGDGLRAFRNCHLSGCRGADHFRRGLCLPPRYPLCGDGSQNRLHRLAAGSAPGRPDPPAAANQLGRLMYGKVTHKNLIDSSSPIPSA